jgi:hypothetical protein
LKKSNACRRRWRGPLGKKRTRNDYSWEVGVCLLRRVIAFSLTQYPLKKNLGASATHLHKQHF